MVRGHNAPFHIDFTLLEKEIPFWKYVYKAKLKIQGGVDNYGTFKINDEEILYIDGGADYYDDASNEIRFTMTDSKLTLVGTAYERYVFSEGNTTGFNNLSWELELYLFEE